MPIPQTVRIDPLDLQKNIAIGVSLPFNGPSGPFNKTYSTKDQIKSNLINLLLTNKGERVFNPEFGTDLRRILFEGITEKIIPRIQNIITVNINTFVPQVQVNDIIINTDTNNKENNTISVTVNYQLKISGKADQITIEFL